MMRAELRDIAAMRAAIDAGQNFSGKQLYTADGKPLRLPRITRVLLHEMVNKLEMVTLDLERIYGEQASPVDDEEIDLDKTMRPTRAP